MSLWGELGPRGWVWQDKLVRNGPELARLIAISNLCWYLVWSSRLGMGWAWGAFKIWMVYDFILLFFWYFINLSEKYKLMIFPFENQWKCGPIDFFFNWLLEEWMNFIYMSSRYNQDEKVWNYECKNQNLSITCNKLKYLRPKMQFFLN